MVERWLGEADGDLPICPLCVHPVLEPDPEAVWPRVLYHPDCLAKMPEWEIREQEESAILA